MMKYVKKFLLLSIAAVMIGSGYPAFSQTTGIITGKVLNSSGEPLPGAALKVDGTNNGAITDNEGKYRILNVLEGSKKITANYVGYIKQEKNVNIKSNETIKLDFKLESDIIKAGEVVVKGMREGQIRALNAQKNADNIKNVIDSDLMSHFPDPNTAEALQRVPGISIQRDQGEGRYVLIRGMDARLSSVSVDGEKLPSPEGDIRSVALDVIPSDIIAGIEVNKSITPDMDADAISGSVNIITKKASDYSGRILKGSASGGYNQISEKGNQNYSLTYGDKFGPEKKLGFIISGNYYKSKMGSDNNEFKYTETEINGAEKIVTEEMELRDYLITRSRYGVSSSLDYKFNENSSVFLNGIYNFFDDQEYRRSFTFTPDEGDYTGAYSAEGGETLKALKDRYESQKIMSFAAGGNQLFPSLGNLSADYKLTYSHSEEKEPNHRDIEFGLEDVDMSWTSDHNFPNFTFADGSGVYDPSKYEFSEFVLTNNITKDTNIIGTIDFLKPFTFGANNGEFKFGGKFRNKNKERDNDVKIYDWDGEEDLTLDMVTSGFKASDFLDKSYYRMDYLPDPSKVESFFNNNRSSFEYEDGDSRIETDPENYDATENIAAVYGQGKLNMGKLMVLGGLRLENTSIDYTGYRVIVNEDGDYERTEKISNTNGYLNVFPMVHAKYNIDENTNIRTALTTSIARPDYYSLVPYEFINREDSEIEAGNPELDPTKAVGFDLMAERYFRPLGIISAGFFYKNLEDYIFPKSSEVSGGNYDGYKLIRSENGDKASLYGFEVNWMQQFTFLPSVFSGLGVYANYTYTDSEAKIPFEDNTTRTATLPGQAKNTGNVAVSYEKYGFSGRVSVNFNGEYIDVVGESSAEDEYYDNHTQLDISISQRICQRVSLFADFINLTNEPLRYYYGTSTRPRQQEYYKSWMHCGIKVDL